MTTFFQILVLVLLLAIVVTIIIAAKAITKHIKSSREVEVNMMIDTSAIAHHAQVSAVLALTQTFTDDPELSANLAGYSQQVVDAALLHRVNSLGNSLAALDGDIARTRRSMATSSNPAGHQSYLDAQLTMRATTQRELDAANELVNGRHLQGV